MIEVATPDVDDEVSSIRGPASPVHQNGLRVIIHLVAGDFPLPLQFAETAEPEFSFEVLHNERAEVKLSLRRELGAEHQAQAGRKDATNESQERLDVYGTNAET